MARFCARVGNKEVKAVEGILGWATAGGMGIFLAGLGVFFWGLQFIPAGRAWKRKEEQKKTE